MSISVTTIRTWLSILITNVVAIPLLLLGIYTFNSYGLAIFVILPLLMGLISSVVFCYNQPQPFRRVTSVSFLSLLCSGVFLILFAIEGIVCLVMLAPLAACFNLLGAYLGFLLTKSGFKRGITACLIGVILVPSTAFMESNSASPIHSVSTTLDIDAPIETVWQNVVAFPKLGEPEELLFKTGISYPINAEIIGDGVGAIRYCNFNAGSFVEPITKWNAPYILEFDVEEQPVPLTELSPWDIDAPHLHDYFLSKKGRFELVELENGKTRLTGTTWYVHNIKPDGYWKLWSNYIIHQIHFRVLIHIKTNSELNT